MCRYARTEYHATPGPCSERSAMSSAAADPPPLDLGRSPVAADLIRADMRNRYAAARRVVDDDTLVIINGPAEGMCKREQGALSLYRLLLLSYPEYDGVLKALGYSRPGVALVSGLAELFGEHSIHGSESYGKGDPPAKSNLKWAYIGARGGDFVRQAPTDAISANAERGLTLDEAVARISALTAPALLPPPPTPSADPPPPADLTPSSRHELEVAALHAIEPLVETERGLKTLVFGPAAQREARNIGGVNVPEHWARVRASRSGTELLSASALRERRRSLTAIMEFGGMGEGPLTGLVIGLVREYISPRAAAALVRKEYDGNAGLGGLRKVITGARVGLVCKTWGAYVEVCSITRDAAGTQVLASVAQVRALLREAAPQYTFWNYLENDAYGIPRSFGCFYADDAQALMLRNIRDIKAYGRWVDMRIGPRDTDGYRRPSLGVLLADCQEEVEVAQSWRAALRVPRCARTGARFRLHGSTLAGHQRVARSSTAPS